MTNTTRPSSLHISIATLALLLISLVAIQDAAAEVRWRSGDPVGAQPMQPAELQSALEGLAARSAARHVVAHLDGTPADTRRAALQERGLTLLDPLGDHAWFARLERGVDPAPLLELNVLRRVEAIDPVRKLHPELAGGIVRPWTVVPVAPKTGRPDPKTDDPASWAVAVVVVFHRDFDSVGGAHEVLGPHGGKIVSWIGSLNGVTAHMPAANVKALAAEDAVMWVEPPLPRLSVVNDSARPRIGAETLQVAPYGLDGSGVTVLVYDGGQMFDHGDFSGRLTVGLSDTSGVADHATHVGGTIGGDGSGSSGQYRGMAPAVDLISYGFEQEGGLQQGFLYTDPGDIEADYSEAMSLYGVDLSNNSIGTNTAPNGYPCEWEGNYGTTGALIDAIVGGSLGDPFRIVWANGNERQGSARCGSTYLTTAPPACAKNHITVGAMNSNDDSVTDFTSWGPCDDGRIKPDISGPGCESGGDNGLTSTSSSGGYTVKCGTSMASPSVAGASALLLQQYRSSFPGRPDFRNSTLKAILATTAEDIETTGPDYMTGYGSVRAVPAADLIAEERFVEAELAQGEVRGFIIVVGPDDTELKVTLAWDDAPGTPNVDPVLVNDLDLRVIDGGGTTHFPWTLDPANPADPAVRTQRDGLNNIEQVVIDNPTPGAYRVEVEGFNIVSGPTQSYSVAAGPTLINCAPAGNLATDARRIGCEATLGLTVIDCDLNADDGLAETVDVDVVSDTEPGGETVTLTENAPESAAFFGSVPVSATDAAGTLQITEGGTVTVTYIDADDGDGGINVPVTRDVTVDCTAPVITDVRTAEINPRDALIEVDTDEESRVTAHVGTVCGVPDLSETSFSLSTTHSVRVAGLVDDATYWYTIDAVDEAGNATSDDNGGSCYEFTTPEIPDFFTEQFGAGIDLAGSQTTFTPNGTFEFYDFCTEPNSGTLPTDPTGGTVLALTDDQPGQFDLTGGAQVCLYGQCYTTVHIGPNGYLTFDSGDSTYTETLTAHFSQPRISALFDDLNPTAGGTVSWKQTGDRLAVSWEGVAEYSTTNSNTFQIEIFFDGRIRVSWVQLDVQDAIVGLSAGAGLDPEFLPSDLSSSLGCGPQPPVATNLATETTTDTPLPLTLLAVDDGLPAPPVLTYRIVRLPSYGSLIDDATATPIDSVPWVLGGDGVTFTPAAGGEGWDSFDFKASDGGAAPDGGDSNLATVGVAIVGTRQVIHEFLVDDTDPGWATTGAWAFGTPMGGGTHDLDPTGGATGVNVYGYELSPTGDYIDDMVAEYLTSDALDLSGVSATGLEFQRWLGVESATYDHATVEVSTDGTSWTTVWDHTATSALSESAWSLQSYDISAVADGQPTVYLRWVMGTTDVSITYPGWNIDDIRITSAAPVTCAAPPAEAPNLGFDNDKETLQWERSPYASGDAPVYDVLRSADPTDFVTATLCAESDDGADTRARDANVPAPGQVWLYLVRPESTCGVGSLGQLTSGAERSGRACP